MSMNRVYINNAEYNIIYQSQGFDTDKLCSVFVHLRGSKGGKRRYEPKGKLGHYSLLKSETGLSRHSLEKYVPQLVKLGLVKLNLDGGVTVIGFDSSFKRFKTNKKKKAYIPISMEKSYLKTAVSVGNVRIINSINAQEKYIDKKDTQTKLIKRHLFQLKNPNLQIMSKAQNRAIGRILEKHGSFEKFQSTYCEETILSQQGFANLNKGKDGRYFKKQLVDCGMIESKIRLEEILKNISYKKYLTLKETIVSVNGRGVFWCPVKRSVFKYLSSSIKRIN